MWQAALQTVRNRWPSFVGMFVALALGTGIMTSMSLVVAATFGQVSRPPERFAAAPVVVRAAVPDWAKQLQASDRPQFYVSPDLLQKAATAGHVIPDRTFYAQLSNGPVTQVGHPWSVAAFASYRLISGTWPAADNEIVVPSSLARLGDHVQVTTAAGTSAYVVKGLVNPVSFESAVFFADSQAARLSPSVDALVVDAPASTISHAVGAAGEVLTGASRHQLDPDVQTDRQALNSTGIVAGMAAGFAAFVIVFIVASTFAFAVTQNQREYALLRLIGASPRQVRYLILFESLAVGTLAAEVGCAIGFVGRTYLSRWLIHLHVAPNWFKPSSSILLVLVVLALGIAVALLGTWPAARRASRTAAIDALREAAAEPASASAGRWLAAIAVLACGILAMGWVTTAQPHLVTVPQIYLGALMLPIAAFALLSLAAIPVVVRFVMFPFMFLRGAVSKLVQANLLTSGRRTAAIITPVVLIIGLSTSLLGAVTTISSSETTELRNELRADYVAVPTTAPGLTESAVHDLESVPGATIATQSMTPIFAADDHNTLRRYHAAIVNPAVFSQLTNIPLASGTFAGLNDTTIIVPEGTGKQVGEQLAIRLSDGAAHTFTVAGVLKPTISHTDVYLSSRYASGTMPTEAYIKVHDVQALNRLAEVATSNKLTLESQASWITATNTNGLAASRLGLVIVLGIAGLYCAIAIVNTMFMAASARIRDFATLRLAGAGLRQVLLVAAGEAAVVFVAGILLALAASAINFVGLMTALNVVVHGAQLVIGWLPVAVIAAACGVLAVAASVLPARWQSRLDNK